jgi:hypothetical protein
MKFFGFLLAGILLAGSSASAQSVTSPTLLTSSSTTDPIYAVDSPAPQPVSFRLPAEPAPAAKPQANVVGVYQEFPFQVYVGYTFMRFYEAPHNIRSLNGFDSSLTYYFSKWNSHIGADGEFFGGFGSQGIYSARLAFGAGGLRARWAAPLGLELWAHGLAGRTHFVPQTAYGPQGAFAYEVGVGVDATGHRQRLAYRLELDMVGSKFFGTYQLSPKASIGVVYKF